MTNTNDVDIEEAFYIYDLAIGQVTIACDKQGITLVSSAKEKDLPGSKCRTVLLDEAAKQLEEYFKGERKQFDLPLNPKGTPFQKQVWEALCKVPYGETRSYKEIAIMIGNPKACRAVGMANNKNPIMILIPCHRVIGANGKLIGYDGGLELKKYLLDLEK
nr:methylated-DNA--[protein]-cysteine S-methyltransferase [uncultured Cellulosilyticum sp.]